MSNLRGNKVRNAVFAIVGLIAMLVSSLTLLALIAALAMDGSSRFSSHFFFSFPSRFPEEAGILSAWVGTSLVMQELTPAHRKLVEKLSALLRIADGLDRSHFSVVQDVTVTLGSPVTIRVQTSADIELEMWAAQARTDLFEKVFKRPVQFEIIRTAGETS